MKIEMIGYNDEKAIAIYSVIKTMPFFVISLIVACFSLIPTLVFGIYELLFVFLLPAIILLSMLFRFAVNINNKTFLGRAKKKHIFCLDSGCLYKDGKEIKNISDIRLYKFKKFIFLELKRSYYRIMNEDYLIGSREEFLSQIKFYQKHYAAFLLPPKTDEEIVDILLKKLPKNSEHLFYCPAERKIIYIYKRPDGIYSIGREKMFIADKDERYYLGKYGWWEPDYTPFVFLGTLDAALCEIKAETKDYIEIKSK